MYLLTSDEDGTDDRYNHANSMKYHESNPYRPNNPSHTVVNRGDAQTKDTYER
jgi:hypothetical protein